MNIKIKMLIKDLMNKTAFHYKRHPILFSLCTSFFIAFVFGIVFVVQAAWKYSINLNELSIFVLGFLCLWIFAGFPFILTLINLFMLFYRKTSQEIFISNRKIELLVIFLGIIYSITYISLGFPDIVYSDWQEQLYNSAMHTPIFTDAMPTVTAVGAVSILGYFIVRYRQLEKMSPLVITFCIGAMYLGVAECILWIVQIWNGEFHALVLCLFPLNFIVIVLKTMKDIILKWREIHNSDLNPADEQSNFYQKPLFALINSWLLNSTNWPFIGLLFSLPLLGVLVVVLALFGQAPDSFIKAWTETADWNLSQRVAPQNISYDEHYLCTVAAGGHKKVVKPLRLGKRHGHEVIVNRQLCIANAFEQILEEKTPHLHKMIRSAYDKYGYPVARHIKSPYTADIIYFFMKPAEWFFLFIIYLCDSKPENRIALQYIHGPDRGDNCGI